MNKWFAICLLLFTSCVEFEFEAPYEDLNGIYLEHILSRDDIYGMKLLSDNHTSYICWDDHLTSYSFAQVDSIYELSTYTSVDYIRDFDIADGFAYIVSCFGLEIVDFQETEPHLSGSLELPGVSYFGTNIRTDNDKAYVTQDDNFYIVDMSDKAHPRKIGEFDFGNLFYPIIWFEVDPHFAYILLYNSAFCILDISDPTNINIVSQVSVMDTVSGSASMFALKDDYLYFLKNSYIETYQLLENHELEYLSSTGFASYSMLFIHVGEKYGIACSGGSWVYLLNLEYPSKPCIAEIYDLDRPQEYGLFKDNYIYLLVPWLEILEIREIQ